MGEQAGTSVAQIGDAEIRRVEEMRQRLPISLLTDDHEFVRANHSWLEPFYDPADQTFELVFQTWIVTLAGKTAVIDPCNGNGRSRPVLPAFDHLDTPFLERLEATGTRPEDVDFVFCTHLHCDHCGWNTRLHDGRWVPTFPNARYLFVRREVERWDPARPGHSPVEYNIGVYEDSVRPILDAGLADLVADHHAILPGLEIEPAYGHTAGHSALHLQSRDEHAWFTGDAFHHPLQVLRPQLHLEGCDDTQQAIATRERLIAEIAARDALMIPAHFSGPHYGRVARLAEGFRFVAPE
jgi:glyoxylase-like metal-dependent hydrolase (beta-lactamase superfamily II)